MAKENVSVKNPFRSDDYSSRIFCDVLQKMCLNKRNGLLFRLFDIGNMSFTDAKLLTFRNVVGNSVRKLMANCKNRDMLEQELENLKENVMRLVRLGNNDGEFLKAFSDSIEVVLNEFINFVDSELIVAKAVEKDKGGDENVQKNR